MWNFTNDKESSFGIIPEGVYEMYVDNVEERKTKSGNDALSLTFVIKDGEYSGRKIFSQYNMSGNEMAVQISRGQLKSLLMCAGKSLDIKGPHEFCGCEVLGSVKIKKDKDGVYDDKNVISFFKAIKNKKSSGGEIPF